MKTLRITTNRREAGLMLIECVVYIGLFAVVLGFATKMFFQSWDDNKGLRRNAEDIVRVLHIGDQWRSDVRAAAGPLKLTDSDGAEQLHIPTAAGDIVYTCSKGELHRQAAAEGVDRIWLSNVKSSQMKSESRENVPAWSWEIELKPARKTVLWRPLFTFETVAGGGVK